MVRRTETAYPTQDEIGALAYPRVVGVVLRIQRSQDGEVVTLTISGGLADEYVAELERVVDAEGVEQRLVLDLKEVTHVNGDGVRRLARLEASGARILACPEYLREWISREPD